MSPLAEIRFRSNPFVELRQLASLDEREREPFRGLESDPDFCGLFVAKPPWVMTVKSAARQTVELFESLRAPSRIAGTLLEDEEFAFDVVDLVLDGILEVESDGDFVSGADALRLVPETAPDPGGALSREALLHAQELETNDPQRLTAALYHYNHIPISPFWRARFAGPNVILAHVGADRGPLHAILERDWELLEDKRAWLCWRSLVAPLPRDRAEATYKLYVSPRPERIADAFEVLVRTLSFVPATFKMGNSAAGLLRPDKLVAYFGTREELEEAASMLRRELAGCDPHGVPFTAAADAGGLLSWGVDPPESECKVAWMLRMSWRSWIAQRLGGALSIAKTAHSAPAVEPWRFALARIQRLGVDVATWTPHPRLWRTP
jgi:hypothetical protein